VLQAEKRLGFRINQLEKKGISVSEMLTQAKPEILGLSDEQIQQTKERVFDNIVEYIEAKGYPMDSDENYDVGIVTDLVMLIIVPILAAFRRGTSSPSRNLSLEREREIITVDSEIGGIHDFVGIDLVGVGKRKFVFLANATNSLVGKAKRKCLLALKDIRGKNRGGIVYGFVTTAEEWQMVQYNGTAFTQSNRFQVMFQGMGHERERWMREGAVIVDCIHMVLRSGGFVGKYRKNSNN